MATSTIGEKYQKCIPRTFEDGLSAVLISGLSSGALAALQVFAINVSLSWAAAGAAATAIDGWAVGPATQMIAEGFGLQPNSFLVQSIRVVSVIGIVYSLALPTISAMAGVAMTVNVLGTLLMTVLAATVNRTDEMATGVDAAYRQRIFSYFFVPTSLVLWGPLVGIVAAR
jgi:hypothetical protein